MSTCGRRAGRSGGLTRKTVQYARECFCGPQAPGQFGPANCDMPCAGDAGEICGGDNANLVFENLVEPDGGWNEVESPPGFIPQPDIPPPADGAVRLRVMSWNVFYASLGAESRKEGVAQTLADYGPDIVRCRCRGCRASASTSWPRRGRRPGATTSVGPPQQALRRM